MDRKGESIAIAKIGSKIITRSNLALNSPLNIKFFGISFNSWHAEIRILKAIIQNNYLLNLARQYGIHIHILRFTNAKNLTNSKPCNKCQKCLEIFSDKYGIRIRVSYIEDNKVKFI